MREDNRFLKRFLLRLRDEVEVEGKDNVGRKMGRSTRCLLGFSNGRMRRLRYVYFYF